MIQIDKPGIVTCRQPRRRVDRITHIIPADDPDPIRHPFDADTADLLGAVDIQTVRPIGPRPVLILGIYPFDGHLHIDDRRCADGDIMPGDGDICRAVSIRIGNVSIFRIGGDVVRYRSEVEGIVGALLEAAFRIDQVDSRTVLHRLCLI